MADKTISSLPALATISKEDVLLVVDNPAGTPVNRKISIEGFFSNVEPIVLFANTQSATSTSEASVVFEGGVSIKKNLIIDGDVEIRGSTSSGTTTIGAVTNHITLIDSNVFDLANSANPFRTIYVNNVGSGESGTINVYSNTTNFYSNVNFYSNNLQINNSQLNVHANSTFHSNVHVESSSDVFTINSKDLNITSDINLMGSNLDVSSDATFTGDFTHTGSLTLLNNDQFIANSDNFIAYGNVVIGMFGNDGNPKGTTTNVNISASNTYMKTDLTFKGTQANYFSNIYVHSTNTSITSSNTFITSDIFVNGESSFKGLAKFDSSNFTVVGSNNYFIGRITSKTGIRERSTTQSSTTSTGALVVDGGVGIAKNLNVGENLSIGGELTLNDNLVIPSGSVAQIDADTVFAGSNTFIDSSSVRIQGGDLTIDNDTHFTSVVQSTDYTNGSVLIDGGVGIAKNLNVGGSIHAVGNITANGNIQLGDSITDTVSVIGRVQSDFVPITTDIYNLGATGSRFNSAYIKNLFLSANATISDSLQVSGKRTRLGCNTEILGTNFSVSSNSSFTAKKHNITGQNTHITSNTTIEGTNTVFTSNISVTNSDVNINSSNILITVSDYSLTADELLLNGDNYNLNHSNTFIFGEYFEIKSNTQIDSTDFKVLANTEFNGSELNIYTDDLQVTANVDFTGTDLSVSANVDFTGTDLSVSANSAFSGDFNLTGNILNISSDSYFDLSEFYISSSNTHIIGTKTFIDSSLLEINSNTVFDSEKTTFNNEKLELKSSNTYITSNLNIINESTHSTISNLEISGDSATIGSTNLKIYGNLFDVTSNAQFDSETISFDGGDLTILSNVYMFNSNTHIAGNTHFISNTYFSSDLNITGNNTLIDSELLIKDKVFFGVDGISNDIVVYGNTPGEKIKYDASDETITFYAKMITTTPVQTENSLVISNNHSILFREKIVQQDSNANEGNFLTEDGNDTIVLEDLASDSIVALSEGMRFNSKNYLFGRGDLNVGYGSSNIFIMKDGLLPQDTSNIPIDQSHLYSKKENIKNNSDVIVNQGSYLHTLSSDGYESVLGMHNSSGDYEIISRNTQTGQTFRLNIFELARIVEALDPNLSSGSILKEEQ